MIHLTRRRGYKSIVLPVLLAVAILLFAGCRQDEDPEPTLAVAPASTSTPTPSISSELLPESEGEITFITIATDAPSRFQDFEDIDPFGNVVGFDPDVMSHIAAELGIDYEFVVTSFDGLLESISNDEFDAAMSALLIPEQPEIGLAYTEPYLEVGQVLVVRANESVILSHSDIEAGIPVGAQRFTSGEQVARGIIGLTEPDLQLYDNSAAALQALINGEVEGVIIDNDDAEYFTTSFPQQLKIVGGSGREAWISGKAYGIAVAADNEELKTSLNQVISQARLDGTIDLLVETWLVSDEGIVAGESLVGTPVDELVIGVAGQLTDMDPAATTSDFISWELKSNTMSGLLMIDEANNLSPLLATGFPQISEDKLEYTFTLRPGITFPDGSELDAEDVEYSIERAAMLGNYLVNSYLKDENDDSFADNDSVQIIDPLTIKFVLNEPLSFFPSLLATPPYFVVNSGCYQSTPDPVSNCGGIGKYSISEWEPGAQMRLEANPLWLGAAPNFNKLQIRFYDDPDRMRRSLENNAIDVAWTGLARDDILELRDRRGYVYWEGPPVFKSYLVFEQSAAPWDDAQVRKAVALAVDRDALAAEVFEGARTPLFSPIPAGTLGHNSTEPVRDLAQAQSILATSGYSSESKLEIELWYEDGGRYSDIEADYAELLKAQLEETGLITVVLQGAPYSIFRPQSATCNYPSYLLGWPSPGQPASFVDAMSWLEYFITNTDTVCSNYESEAMDALYQAALEETDETARLELYRQMQELWAQDFPTLDLTQEPRVAITQPNVTGVVIDSLGLLHFDALAKSGG